MKRRAEDLNRNFTFGSAAPRNAEPRKPIPKKWIGIGILVILLLILAGESFYTIGEQENAVVTTFGVPQAVTTPGLHFKIPFVQQVNKVSMIIFGLPIGYDPSTNRSIPDESLMITSDYNFVNVDFYIEYRVTDPIAFLFNAENPTEILKTLAMSFIRDTVGVYGVDDVITTGKSQIQSDVKEKLGHRLENENIGLQVVNVTIQDAEPPTSEVLAAFKEVENAKQGAETALNNANKYKSELIPTAEAEADRLLQQAEATKTARINEANGQVARFNSMYEEYQRYPEITRQRMYYEAMEEILPGVRVIIQGKDGNALHVFDFGDSGTKSENP
ncbi:MAG: FtsH protease activity modulator HflK [Clostridia bacterium]|nr:FtsH protease activity modulator HflK [Clostridia bacterium]